MESRGQPVVLGGEELLFALLLILAVPPVVHFLLGLHRPIYVGSVPKGIVESVCLARVRFTHWLAGATAFGLGAMIVNYYSDTWFYMGVVVAGLLVGWAVSGSWTRLRARHSEYTQHGMPDVQEEGLLFPSDRFARSCAGAHVPPLPAWVNLLVLALCASLGTASGLLVRSIAG